MLEKLERERRAVPVRIAGEERWIAAEDAGLYRDALGVPPPGGLPESFLEPVDDAMVGARAPLRAHPRAVPDRRSSPAATASTRRRRCASSSAAGELVRGELLPGGTEREWCDADVLRRVRRASVAAPAPGGRGGRPGRARPLPARAGRTSTSTGPPAPGPDRLREALVPLQGVALTPEVWERDVLPAPARRLQPGLARPADHRRRARLDRRRRARRAPGRVALYFREDVRLAGPPPANAKLERPEGEVHDAIRERLAAAPCFWIDLVAELDVSTARSSTSALWDLAWAGEATNDAFAPLRARRLSAVAQPARARRAASPPAAPGAGGDRPGPLVADRVAVPRARPPQGPRLRAQAELMLERYGIVTRETVLAEGVPGGFSSLYGELSNLEMLGTARRGYFVEGLGGAQFALAGAVERLRSLPRAEGEYLQSSPRPTRRSPTAPSLPWPKRDGGPAPGPHRRAPTCCCATATRSSTSSAAASGIVRLVELEGEELVEAVVAALPRRRATA